MKESMIENALLNENVIGLQQQELRPGTQRSGLPKAVSRDACSSFLRQDAQHREASIRCSFLSMSHSSSGMQGFYVISSQVTNLISLITEGVLHRLGQYREIMSARKQVFEEISHSVMFLHIPLGYLIFLFSFFFFFIKTSSFFLFMYSPSFLINLLPIAAFSILNFKAIKDPKKTNSPM